jgi:protease-4
MNDWNNSSPGDEPKSFFLWRWMRRFGRWLRNFFALVGFLYTIVPIAIIWIFYSYSQPSRPSHEPNKHSGPRSLWLNLDSEILEHQTNMSQALMVQIFGGDGGIYLPDLRSSLKKAAEDATIKDLNINISGLSGSAANLEELRAILVEFRETSKKPVQSWVHRMDNAALLASSATDKVYLAPASEVMIPGPVFSQIYGGDAFRKLGIDLQVVRAGKYKSAFEAFIANDPSPESKEMMGSLESSLRDQMVSLIAQGRNKQKAEPFHWLKESIFTATKAKELGIVDELAYLPSIDFESGENIAFEDYAETASSGGILIKKGYSLTPESGIALIEATGEIVPASDDERSITPEALKEELEWARTNKEVSAVVLRVSSPGGSASASDEIWEYVKRLNAEKPVIASFGSVAASGGYYISVGARKIIANPSTITGSIGVIGLIPNFGGFRDKYGITFPVTTQSNRAVMLSGSGKMTPEDQKYIGDSIDETYRTFKSRVSEGRKLSMEKVESMAQGRVFSGIQALELGLVDQLGTMKDAFQVAKVEAGLDPDKLYPIHRYEGKAFSLSECLSSPAKMRRCLRRHGSQLKSSLAAEGREYLIGEDAKVAATLRQIKQLKTSKERAFALYQGPTL